MLNTAHWKIILLTFVYALMVSNLVTEIASLLLSAANGAGLEPLVPLCLMSLENKKNILPHQTKMNSKALIKIVKSYAVGLLGLGFSSWSTRQREQPPANHENISPPPEAFVALPLVSAWICTAAAALTNARKTCILSGFRFSSFWYDQLVYCFKFKMKN